MVICEVDEDLRIGDAIDRLSMVNDIKYRDVLDAWNYVSRNILGDILIPEGEGISSLVILTNINPYLIPISLIKRGAIIFTSYVEDPVLYDILRRFDKEPYCIPVVKGLGYSIDFIIENAVENMYVILSIPNRLCGWFDFQFLSRILDVVEMEDGRFIIDARYILELYEVGSDNKLRYRRELAEDVWNKFRDYIERYYKYMIFISSFQLYGNSVFMDHSIPFIISDINVMKRMEKYYALYSDGSLDYLKSMVLLWLRDVAHDRYLEYIHRCNMARLEYLKIFFEEMFEYIILPPSNIVGGSNFVLGLEWKIVDYILNYINSSTIFDAVIVGNVAIGKKRFISISSTPRGDYTLDDYMAQVENLKKIISSLV
jgi:hypothetical protein